MSDEIEVPDGVIEMAREVASDSRYSGASQAMAEFILSLAPKPICSGSVIHYKQSSEPIYVSATSGNGESISVILADGGLRIIGHPEGYAHYEGIVPDEQMDLWKELAGHESR